jgi:uncharacterized membrane protein YhaH (DUF805 family)
VNVRTGPGWMSYYLRHYFRFEGRGSRMEFLLVGAFYFGLGQLFKEVKPHLGGGGPVVLLAWTILIAIPSLAATSRRLHDTSHSFWWAAPVYAGLGAILVAGQLFTGRPSMGEANWAWAARLTLLLWLGYLLWMNYLLLLKKGTKGPNRYGAEP